MRLFFRLLRAPAKGTAEIFFSPHIHTKNCIVCESTAAAAMTQRSSSPASAKNEPSKGVVVCNRTDEITKRQHGNLTLTEIRVVDIKRWVEEFGVNSMIDSCASARERGTSADEEYLQTSWNAFCDSSHTLTQKDLEGAIAHLAGFCDIKEVTDDKSHESTSCSTHMVPSSNVSTNLLKKGDSNAFLKYVETQLASREDVKKQLHFQHALLDFREIADFIQLPFFICCGTALGARRDGYFVPHDYDIDVGVFYEDLQKMCASNSTGSEIEGGAQSAVIGILSQVAVDGRFVIFDLCGTVERGLELRFVHEATQIPLDLNVYYSHLPGDEDLLSQHGQFVWTASYYNNAAQRKHGMYRYRHQNFRSRLSRLPFCDAVIEDKNDPSKTSGGFLVPPESYLEEYFGVDWRTPRKYTYEEGLEREYKNIIDE